MIHCKKSNLPHDEPLPRPVNPSRTRIEDLEDMVFKSESRHVGLKDQLDAVGYGFGLDV